MGEREPVIDGAGVISRRRRALLALTTVASLATGMVAIAPAAEAQAPASAGCIGEDRSDPSYPNGREYAALVVEQLEFDRLNDSEGSTGRSRGVVASTNCFTR